MNQNPMTPRQAAAEARECANACIEQMERNAKGWDKGRWRSDVREVDRNASNTIRANMAFHVNHAFTLSAQYGRAQ